MQSSYNRIQFGLHLRNFQKASDLECTLANTVLDSFPSKLGKLPHFPNISIKY